MREVEQFGERTKKVKSEYKFKGKIINLRLDEVELPSGKIVEREVVEHRGAAGIVPITSDNKVILLRQYRYPANKMLWEIPAGLLDAGETPLDCAIRELKEETGCTAKSFIKLAEFYLTPGNSNEYFHLYLAKDLKDGDADFDEDEVIVSKKIQLNDALKMLNNDEINDAKTMIGLCLVEKFLRT